MKVVLYPFLPITNASARYRLYKLVPYLEMAGHKCKVLPPAPDWLYRYFYPFIIYKSQYILLSKAAEYIRDIYSFVIVYLCRTWQVFRWGNWPDVIIIQRELYRGGNLAFEKMLRLKKPTIVWDFDDALYAQDGFKQTKHVEQMAAMADIVMAGNETLADYVKPYAKKVIVAPTSVDLRQYTVKDYTTQRDTIIIGWIGNPSNLKHLLVVITPLQIICKKYPNVVVRIITTGGSYNLQGVKTEKRSWELGNEIEDIKEFDIGIMPLLDNEYTRGKCGFKLIQYMACGLPSVASPVGVRQKDYNKQQKWFLG